MPRLLRRLLSAPALPPFVNCGTAPGDAPSEMTEAEVRGRKAYQCR